MSDQHLSILKRVGWVLLLVGVIDIAYMIYCISNSISYSSSLNIFAVIAGVFLLRGNLRAVSIIRWFTVFMLAAMLSMMVVWPVLQPWDLTRTQFRLNPSGTVLWLAFIAFAAGLLFWVARELGRDPVRTAITGAGRKWRDMRVPAASGVALVALLGVLLPMFLGGETANRAKAMAEQQLGPGYRLHVSSLHVVSNAQGKSVSSVVVAWNANEVKNVSVSWRE